MRRIHARMRRITGSHPCVYPTHAFLRRQSDQPMTQLSVGMKNGCTIATTCAFVSGSSNASVAAAASKFASAGSEAT